MDVPRVRQPERDLAWSFTLPDECGSVPRAVTFAWQPWTTSFAAVMRTVEDEPPARTGADGNDAALVPAVFDAVAVKV